MLPSLPGLPLGTIPPIPSAAPSALDSAVPLPSGTLATTGATGLSSLLGLAGSLVSPVTQTAPANGTTTAATLTNVTPDSFVAKIAYLVLGIVFIGGAIYTYVK